MAFNDRRTPSRPVDLIFGPELGLPSDNQVVTLIGHRGAGVASGASGVGNYSYQTINNAADVTAASTEAGTKFGQGSELQAMVVAAVSANNGNTVIPSLRAIPLPDDVTDFGPSDEALVTARANRAEFLVSPYDAALQALRTKLRDTAEFMSGAERVENFQFGTFGVAFNRDVADPSNLPAPDSRFLLLFWLRDTGTGAEAPVMSVAQMAAACAARTAGNGIPFQNLNSVRVAGVPAPAKQTDWITVGANAESETALQKGWTPLKVKPNGDVAFVRTVSARLFQANGVTPVSAYYDVQDLQVLYFWKRTVFTRLSQPDLVNIKASGENAVLIKSEILRLAQSFEDQDMFQSVARLAPLFRVTRASTDRSRFDIYTPVNVIPGLHVVTTTVEATTQFDTLTV